MTAPASSPPWWAPYIPVVSAVGLVCGVVSASGGYVSQLKENTAAIKQLQDDARTDGRSRTLVLQQLDVRLARIEVTLELMAPAKGKAR